MKIRPLLPTDYPTVQRIYNEGIATKMATFETAAPDWEGWNKKFLPACRFIAEVDGKIGGWIALTPFSARHCYRGVAELSVYIGSDFRGQQLGKRLLEHLIIAAPAAGFWTLQATIFAKNKISIRLHENLGFRISGIRERIAQVDDEWCDTVLMERRF
ncbi:MAG: N-acetyltransferase family protein [Saprospiraceae bacterium]